MVASKYLLLNMNPITWLPPLPRRHEVGNQQNELVGTDRNSAYLINHHHQICWKGMELEGRSWSRKKILKLALERYYLVITSLLNDSSLPWPPVPLKHCATISAIPYWSMLFSKDIKHFQVIPVENCRLLKSTTVFTLSYTLCCLSHGKW